MQSLVSGIPFRCRIWLADCVSGTPNGVGLAHLLNGRKQEFGLRAPTGVRVFQSDSIDQDPCLAFSMAPVPPTSTSWSASGLAEANATEKVDGAAESSVFIRTWRLDPDASLATRA
jgi:hypothetical protein